MRGKARHIRLAFCLLVLLSAAPQACTWLVPSECPTIHTGLDSVAYGDTVMLAESSYGGPGNYDVDYRGMAVGGISKNGDSEDCSVTPGSSIRGFRNEIVPIRTDSLEKIGLPTIPVCNGSPRSLAVLDEPGSTGREPVVVVAGERRVLYFSGVSQEPVRIRTFASLEFGNISQNGRYLAVFSRLHNRRTGRDLCKMRVEDWTGAVLWEMDYCAQGMFEPTPTGGFLTYTTLDPKEFTWDLYEDMPYPRSFPHPLYVYGSDGELLLEGVGYEESRHTLGSASMTPDGRHLAVLFRWILPEIRHKRGVGYVDVRDRACLVLYDLVDGAEEWRHYFAGNTPAGLAIAPGARRIVCSVSTSEADRWGADYHLYCFNDKGMVLFDVAIPSRDPVVPPREIQLSPDGGICTARTKEGTLLAYETDEGSKLLEWAAPVGSVEIRESLIDDSGRLLVVGKAQAQDSTRLETRMYVVDCNRAEERMFRIALAEENLILGIAQSIDGTTLWLLDTSELHWLRLTQDTFRDGED